MRAAKNRITVGQTIAGNPIDIVSYTLSAPKAGKRVYIQSGMHGGEITYWIQHRLYTFLQQHMLAGEVIFVPFANPASWDQRSYFYTFGKFDLYDGRDPNTYFPGKEDGNLHQRIAFALSSLARDCDLGLDLHTARNSLPYTIYTQAQYAPLVKTMGLTYNYFDGVVTPDTLGSFDTLMDPLGRDNLCIECGSHDEYDAAKNDAVFAGILRLLAGLGIVGAEHLSPAPADCYAFKDHKKIVAPESGFIRYDVKLGQPFKKGDRLFTLHRTAELGSEYAEIASEDGVAYKWTPTHIYRVGDDTLHYVPTAWMEKL